MCHVFGIVFIFDYSSMIFYIFDSVWIYDVYENYCRPLKQNRYIDLFLSEQTIFIWSKTRCQATVSTPMGLNDL